MYEYSSMKRHTKYGGTLHSGCLKMTLISTIWILRGRWRSSLFSSWSEIAHSTIVATDAFYSLLAFHMLLIIFMYSTAPGNCSRLPSYSLSNMIQSELMKDIYPSMYKHRLEIKLIAFVSSISRCWFMQKSSRMSTYSSGSDAHIAIVDSLGFNRSSRDRTIVCRLPWNI